MGSLSIRIKIFFLFFILVVASSLIIALIEANYLDNISYEAIVKHGENLSRTITLEASKKIPSNDLTSLQNVLKRQLECNPNIAYLLLIKDRQILARAFSKEISKNYIDVNTVTNKKYSSIRQVVTDNGRCYLDLTTPVLSGQAGVLRIGLSERLYKSIKSKLWFQLSGYIFLILIIAITVSFYFIRRITRPLSDMADIAGRIDEKNFDMQVPSNGDDEVAKLGVSFNYMLNRIREHTHLAEKHSLELDRARHLTINSFEIIRKIWEQDNLKGSCSYLLSKIQEIVACKVLVLFIFSKKDESLFIFMNDQLKILKKDDFNVVFSVVKQHRDKVLLKKNLFKLSLGPETFQYEKYVWTIPVYQENQLLGALLIPYPDNCPYHKKDLEVVQLILEHTSRAIQRAVSSEEEILGIQRSMDLTNEYFGIVGKDSKMKAIYKLIDDIAPTDTTILIQGESGTGKELVASAIHRKSHRSNKPFVVINCSAYPSTLLESELFGHEKGAFTGAVRQKIGRFELAHGGTVFLDEIGEIPLPAQIKLLRILQTQKFERVGGENTICLDVRILAASNKDLLQEVKKGNFREDLYYRLNVIPIEIPPLRKRQNDIPLQARYFLRRFAEEQGKNVVKFSPQAMRLLMNHSWPGNVRELENCVEHAVVLAQGKWIEVSDLPNEFRQTDFPTNKKDDNMLRENEVRLLKEALDDCDWNKKMAARRLGISRNTLYRRIKQYQIKSPSIH